MKYFRLIIFIWLLCVVGALAQPAPIRRNAMSTNFAGTSVLSSNNLSVTNFSGGLTHTQWNFYGRSPDTIARLIDISNVVNSVSGSATNAVSTIESNGVVVTAMATNMNFVDSPSLTWLLTNSPSGKIHVSATVVGGGSGGETNWLGDAGTTNATRIGLADGKSNNTNLVKTLMGGSGVILTNNVGGTNVMIAIDPAIVASQVNLNAASNVLYGIAGETNWNGNAGTTNATRIGLADGKSNNTNLIKTVQGGNGIVVTNETGGTNVVFAIDPAVVASQENLNASSNFLYSVRGESNWVANAFGTNSIRFGWHYVKENGTNYLKTFSEGFGMAFTNQGSNVVFAVDNAVIASQVNLNAASNALVASIDLKQSRSQVLSNLVGTVAFNVTNVVSLSTSNALSKPITNLYAAGTLTLRGIEAGANVTITANPSNYVIAAAGGGSGALAIQTNRVNLGTETNLNFVNGTGIITLATNLSGTNDIQFNIDPEVVASQVNLNAASNVFRTDISNLQGSTNFNQTNIVSLSTTNAVSKPLTNSYVNGLLVLRGLEAGANITITANPSNYVIASSGGGSGSLSVQTNRVNLGTETNLNFVTGNAISILSTNVSGTNDIQFTFTTFIDITTPPYSAKGDGTTDDTAAFSAACGVVGATVMVPFKAAGYLVNGFFITNNVTLSGPGGQQSRLIFNPGATGFMIDGHTNNFGITIRNLELYGTNDTASYSGVSAAGARSGVRLMGYANGNKVQNVFVCGFDNAGICITSTNTSTLTSVVLGSNNVSISQCDFRRNFISLDVDDSLSEYVRVDNCRAYESRFGFRMGSGSALMTGCEAFTNRFAFYIYGTNNDGHGSIVDAIINHNVYPLTFDSVANGFLVDSCQIWEGIVWITNSTMVQVQNCMGSVGEWQCSTGGRNWVQRNRWFTTFGNTVTHNFGGGAADGVIFSDNIANNGTVIGEHSLYAYSNVTFQGNSSFTNVSATNYVIGSQHVNRSIISNSFALLNFAPSVGAVWTCTNATTGEGRWSTNQGTINLQVHSAMFPSPPTPGLDTGTNNTWRLLFDDATNEVTYFQFPLPDNYFTNAQLMFHYSTLAAAANTSNVWEVAVMVVPGMGGKTINTDSYNGSVSITQQVNSTAGFLNMAMISCNATSAIAGDLLKLRLTRKGTNLFDNASGDSAVHALIFEFDKKAQ